MDAIRCITRVCNLQELSASSKSSSSSLHSETKLRCAGQLRLRTARQPCQRVCKTDELGARVCALESLLICAVGVSNCHHSCDVQQETTCLLALRPGPGESYWHVAQPVADSSTALSPACLNTAVCLECRELPVHGQWVDDFMCGNYVCMVLWLSQPDKGLIALAEVCAGTGFAACCNATHSCHQCVDNMLVTHCKQSWLSPH